MLEELLKNEKRDPGEEAYVMLSFVQVELQGGGANAEKRFFSLYGLLCDNIFGSIQGAKEEYKHKQGGWLSSQYPWRRPSSQTRSSSGVQRNLVQSGSTLSSSSASRSLESDPVVKLLQTSGRPAADDPTLIEAISKESERCQEVVFPLPLFALPKTVQATLLALTDQCLGWNVMTPTANTNVVMSENYARLFGHLLIKPMSDQYELKSYRQQQVQKQEQRQPLRISPMKFNASMITSPTTSTNKGGNDDEASSPNVFFSMLEYYLFVFIRYPLAAPKPVAEIRGREPYGEIVYNYLFKRYLKNFLPYEPSYGRSIDVDATTTRESELFLRIIIAIWLESQIRVTPTATMLRRRQRRGGLSTERTDLNSSFDFVFSEDGPLPVQVQKCLRSMVAHVVQDPAIRARVVEGAASDASRKQWCLSGSMAALQQPFFNYVRTCFVYASIHNSDSAFFAALNSWLIWLEPWNLVPRQQSTHATQRIMRSVSGKGKAVPRVLFIPKYDQASKYSSLWEPYIAANLYLYTVPLAIFLRRARELDFSPSKFDRSIQLVKRIFRVFSPAVIDAISRHLNSPKTPNITRHVKILGPDAPPSGPMSLASCQDDMKTLLEEIYTQHNKKVRDLDFFARGEAFFEGLFGGGVVAGEEKSLHTLMERAKLIVHLPTDYEVIQGSESQQVAGSGQPFASIPAPDRTMDGRLTALGLEQVINGTAKCRPEDISFKGDPMRARRRNHEIALLITFTIYISDRLNKRFDLVDTNGNRIIGRSFNLRFLADYRWPLFLSVVGTITWKVLRWMLFG